mmetsp:Transcript_8117/g.15946  ORF Transcript_8117/g.15946 Transcript_8117/m.15946 type:complete len:153 (+) Transcript_8117:106-564(+)
MTMGGYQPEAITVRFPDDANYASEPKHGDTYNPGKSETIARLLPGQLSKPKTNPLLRSGSDHLSVSSTSPAAGGARKLRVTSVGFADDASGSSKPEDDDLYNPSQSATLGRNLDNLLAADIDADADADPLPNTHQDLSTQMSKIRQMRKVKA